MRNAISTAFMTAAVFGGRLRETEWLAEQFIHTAKGPGEYSILTRCPIVSGSLAIRRQG